MEKASLDVHVVQQYTHKTHGVSMNRALGPNNMEKNSVSHLLNDKDWKSLYGVTLIIL